MTNRLLIIPFVLLFGWAARGIYEYFDAIKMGYGTSLIFYKKRGSEKAFTFTKPREKKVIKKQSRFN
jgi:hypothetical protein